MHESRDGTAEGLAFTLVPLSDGSELDSKQHDRVALHMMTKTDGQNCILCYHDIKISPGEISFIIRVDRTAHIPMA